MDDLSFWGNWCVRIIVCSTTVSALGLAAMLSTRKQHAAQRHFCGAFMCVMLLLVPALCLFVPGRSFSWGVVGETALNGGGRELPVSEPARKLDLESGSQANGSGAQILDPPRKSQFVTEIAFKTAQAELGKRQSSLESLSPDDAHVAKSSLAVGKSSRTTGLLIVVAAIYCIGGVILLLKLLYSHLLIWKLRRGPLHGLSPQAAADLQPRLAAYHDRVRLDSSGRISVPIVVGIVNPTVILPRYSDDWSSEKRNAVLAHELTHIARNDPIIHLLAHLSRCFYWPNPLVHVAIKDMHRSQEIACDQQAALDCCDSLFYARSLVEIALDLRHQNKPPEGALAMSHSDLDKRVSIVLATKLTDAKKWKKRWSLRLLVLAGLMAAAILIDPSADPIATSLMAQSIEEQQSTGGTTDDDAKAATIVSEASSKAAKQEEPAAGDTAGQELRNVVVSGRVVDIQGRPIPRAKIFTGAFEEPKVHTETNGLTSETGDFEVRFKFPAISLTGLHTWFYTDGHGIRVAALRKMARFEDARVEGLSIPLPKYDECRFRVLAPDGTPCPGATLTPYYIAVPNGMMIADEPTGLFAFLPSELRAFTDSQTDSVGEGTVRAIPAQLLNRVAVESEEYGRQIFRRVVGEALEPQVLQLKEVGTIKGTILIEDPKQLAGMKFHLRSDSAYSTAEVDELGQFELSGPVDTNARIETAWDTELDVVPSIEHRLPIRGGETRQMTVDTVPAVTVHGQVLNSETGVPVAGAQISLRRTKSLLGWAVYVTTDHEGRYTAKVAPGLLKQQLFAFGMTEKARNYDYPRLADVAIPKSTEVVELEPIRVPMQKVVRGRLVASSGEPIGKQTLACLRKDGHYVGLGATDDSGDFSINVYDWKSTKRLEGVKWVLVAKPRDGLTPAVHETLEVVTEDTEAMVLRLPE